MRAPFSKGFFVGGAVGQRDDDHQGRLPGRQVGLRARHGDRDGRRRRVEATIPTPDNELTFNKLDSVFLSGNATRDDAPNHIRIQSHVPRELAKTWVNLCPAQVYEIPEDQLESGAPDGRRARDRVELRPVRRDQRQGRTADDARGRRRAAVSGDLSADGPRYELVDQAARRTRSSCGRSSRATRRRSHRAVRAAQRAVALPAVHDRRSSELRRRPALPDRGRPPRPRGADRLRLRRRRAVGVARFVRPTTSVGRGGGDGRSTSGRGGGWERRSANLLAERARDEGVDALHRAAARRRTRRCRTCSPRSGPPR